MQPTTHVLIGISVVVAYGLLRYRRLPSWQLLFVAMFASLLPDLVDKPLAWTVGFMPSGRAGLHSLPIAVPIIVAVLVVALNTDRLAHGVAFAWGYLAHIAADFRSVLTLGPEYYYFPNLFWPLLEANPDRSPSFGQHVPSITAELAAEFVVIGLVVGYILYDFQRRQVRSQLR